MRSTSDLTPLLLVVDDQELNLRSIENVLRPRGHVVLKAFTGQQAIDLSSKVSPDAILVARNLPDCDGVGLMRRLKASATVHPSTPILIVTNTALGKAGRLEALGAGAWDIITHPVEANELILRLDTFMKAKQEADRVRDEGLTDPSTGLYNIRGVLQRAKELNADADRSGRPITCITFGTAAAEEGADDDIGISEFSDSVSDALGEVTRVSDTLGRLGPTEFVIVAPGTGTEGAIRLADRVLEALERRFERPPSPIDEAVHSLRAGLYSAGGSEIASAEDLLLRATMALRKAQQDNGGFRVRAYDA